MVVPGQAMEWSGEPVLGTPSRTRTLGRPDNPDMNFKVRDRSLQVTTRKGRSTARQTLKSVLVLTRCLPARMSKGAVSLRSRLTACNS